MESLPTPLYETMEERYRALLEVGKAISAHREIKALFKELAKRLPSVTPFEVVGLILHDPERNVMKAHVLTSAKKEGYPEGLELPMEESASAWVLKNQRPLVMPRLEEETRFPRVVETLRSIDVRSCCFLPLTTAMRPLGAMEFGSLTPHTFGESELEFLGQVAKQVAVAVDNVLHHQDLTLDRERLRLLLEVSESIASHRDLEELFCDLAQRLPQIVPFDYINVTLHDPARDVMRLCFLAASQPSTISPGLELPIDESPAGLVWKTQQPLIVNDVSQERRFSKLMAMFRENGVNSFGVVPLTTAHRRLGALGFGSVEQRAYQTGEIEFMQQVAKQVAIAVENALNYEQARSSQTQLAHERDRQRLLLEINNAVVAHLDLDALFVAVSACLRKVIQHDGSSLLLCDENSGEWRIHVLDFSTNESFVERGRTESVTWSPCCVAIESGKPTVFQEKDFIEKSAISEIARHLLSSGVKSFCSVPLISHNRPLGALNVGRRQNDGFTPEAIELLSQVAQQITLAVENAVAYKQIAQLKDKLTEEKLYLEEEIQTEYNFEEIVGDSQALRVVLKEVQTVAQTGSTVLILGETGTGKELIARALHNHSDRRDRTFVKLNCAAIPTGLLESELFGHEKGAFTGAIATKIGRFELADRGTIFLDEVGEIPLELQVKLLRVLQEQEFERLGSNKTARVNVRVIAATNRDLSKMVDDQTFRSDLYYRLKVFPITVPPLRERPEDIPLLVRHFAQKFAQRMKKRIETIPSEAMKALQHYSWPGNVRELENFVERAVILTQGPDLSVSLAELKRTPSHVTNSGTTTLEQAEREHILKALRNSNWTISGATGAAAKLGMKRTTLQSKMQKLGITRP